MSTVSAGSVARAPRSSTHRAFDLGPGMTGSTEDGGMTPIVTIRSPHRQPVRREPALPVGGVRQAGSMCGRYASFRDAQDLADEFAIAEVADDARIRRTACREAEWSRESTGPA